MLALKKIVLASGNPGKLREFKTLFNDFGYDVLPQAEFDVPDVAETGLSFVENALIKARHACEFTGLPAVADDSGIEVDALKGAPGIFSARFAGNNASDEDNNKRLLADLKDVHDDQRRARYQCVLVFMQHDSDPTPLIASGSWEGSILREPIGEGGFGYDPLFWVPTHKCSAAQLEKTEKNAISHRAIALQNLIYQLREQVSYCQ